MIAELARAQPGFRIFNYLMVISSKHLGKFDDSGTKELDQGATREVCWEGHGRIPLGSTSGSLMKGVQKNQIRQQLGKFDGWGTKTYHTSKNLFQKVSANFVLYIIIFIFRLFDTSLFWKSSTETMQTPSPLCQTNTLRFVGNDPYFTFRKKLLEFVCFPSNQWAK